MTAVLIDGWSERDLAQFSVNVGDAAVANGINSISLSNMSSAGGQGNCSGVLRTFFSRLRNALTPSLQLSVLEIDLMTVQLSQGLTEEIEMLIWRCFYLTKEGSPLLRVVFREPGEVHTAATVAAGEGVVGIGGGTLLHSAEKERILSATRVCDLAAQWNGGNFGETCELSPCTSNRHLYLLTSVCRAAKRGAADSLKSLSLSGTFSEETLVEFLEAFLECLGELPSLSLFSLRDCPFVQLTPETEARVCALLHKCARSVPSRSRGGSIERGASDSVTAAECGVPLEQRSTSRDGTVSLSVSSSSNTAPPPTSSTSSAAAAAAAGGTSGPCSGSGFDFLPLHLDLHGDALDPSALERLEQMQWELKLVKPLCEMAALGRCPSVLAVASSAFSDSQLEEVTEVLRSVPAEAVIRSLRVVSLREGCAEGAVTPSEDDDGGVRSRRVVPRESPLTDKGVTPFLSVLLEKLNNKTGGGGGGEATEGGRCALRRVEIGRLPSLTDSVVPLLSSLLKCIGAPSAAQKLSTTANKAERGRERERESETAGSITVGQGQSLMEAGGGQNGFVSVSRASGLTESARMLLKREETELRHFLPLLHRVRCAGGGGQEEVESGEVKEEGGAFVPLLTELLLDGGDALGNAHLFRLAEAIRLKCPASRRSFVNGLTTLQLWKGRWTDMAVKTFLEAIQTDLDASSSLTSISLVACPLLSPVIVQSLCSIVGSLSAVAEVPVESARRELEVVMVGRGAEWTGPLQTLRETTREANVRLKLRSFERALQSACSGSGGEGEGGGVGALRHLDCPAFFQDRHMEELARMIDRAPEGAVDGLESICVHDKGMSPAGLLAVLRAFSKKTAESPHLKLERVEVRGFCFWERSYERTHGASALAMLVAEIRKRKIRRQNEEAVRAIMEEVEGMKPVPHLPPGLFVSPKLSASPSPSPSCPSFPTLPSSSTMCSSSANVLIDTNEAVREVELDLSIIESAPSVGLNQSVSGVAETEGEAGGGCRPSSNAVFLGGQQEEKRKEGEVAREGETGEDGTSTPPFSPESARRVGESLARAKERLEEIFQSAPTELFMYRPTLTG
uniref:Uncharacterized protein n=1 Tax=Chromera velia CCMP2878 TaxID=1169474 RepID=A0A0G4HYC5_9ALVE|eukprot:Cvel_9453.t1-p1 / transcript=Cvel_9453.t1 / gene=Cvel_9453 / organism=Chromera_velia_CCMP2878 / gene_product=hypothetical protein / transcript_product=hypothetical protein / location=Cvel_scaffold545:49421-55245(+) / protein_length=1077 / sequence_SO=supercontig / SO=protein_coding / is_pseudo=false